jgi:hypothetical protein
MDLFNLLVEEFYNNKELAAEDLPEGFGVPITPVVSYLCFETPLDLIYSKEQVLEEGKTEKSAVKKAKKEVSIAKKGKTSKETGTVYKLTKEQKRALKYIKKKYGRAIQKEIKTFRNNFLAPYQVIKSNLEKSKSIYPKEVFGMSKEEYLRAKKRAENKILNMRSNTYVDLNKEYYGVNSKYKGASELEKITNSNNVNSMALRRVFEKYNLKSSKFEDSDFVALKSKIRNVDIYLKNLIDKISSSGVSNEDIKNLRQRVVEVQEAKRGMSSSDDSYDDVSNFRRIQNMLEKIEEKINELDINSNSKESILSNLEKATSVNGEKITNKTFADEYEMFSLREKIIDDIKDDKNNKYVDEYKHQLSLVKGRLLDRKSDLIGKMSKERASKKLTDDEKKIYELKPGAPKDSDKISDYILKIKEDDFFDPIFYHKSDKMKESEKKIDAEIKRFERSLQSKMEEKDFRLLKKYRLINNLITIKNMKGLKELFGDKE